MRSNYVGRLRFYFYEVLLFTYLDLKVMEICRKGEPHLAGGYHHVHQNSFGRADGPRYVDKPDREAKSIILPELPGHKCGTGMRGGGSKYVPGAHGGA